MQIKQHKLITTISLCSFLFILSFLCLGLSPELLPSSSSAASSTATINVSIPDNISIELSKTNLNIDLAISGGVDVFGSDSTNVEVSTNNYTGYTLSMTDNDTTPTDNTSLIRQKLDPTDPTEPDASIPTIEQDIAGGYTSDTMTASHWGYSIDSSTTGYKAVPPLSATNIIKTTTSASLSDSTPVYFGVKAAPTLMPGTYKSTVIFTAIANYQPSQNNAITAISPATILIDAAEILTIDTNIDYSENLVDATHPLTVTLINTADSTKTATCGSVALVNNNDKLRVTCTTPTTGIELNANYTIRLVFTKLGDLAYNSEDTVAGQDFWSISYMQDMTTGICNSVYTPSSAISTTTFVTNRTDYNNNVTTAGTNYIPQRTLIDKRDNHPYYIKKLADGNCWMDQNLDLDLGTPSTTPDSTNTTMTLTNELTDLNTKTTWTPPYNTQLTYGTVWANNGSDGAKSFTFNDNGTIDVKTGGTDGRYWNGSTGYTTTGNLRDHSGHYYNWPAATAGSGTVDIATDGQNVDDSICPKGWQLPQNSGTKSFDNLIRTVYGISATDTDASVMAEPLHFIRSGIYSYSRGGILYDQGTSGNFCSATAKSDIRAYYLNFSSIYLGPQYGSYKGHGFTVRCVAR